MYRENALTVLNICISASHNSLKTLVETSQLKLHKL